MEQPATFRWPVTSTDIPRTPSSRRPDRTTPSEACWAFCLASTTLVTCSRPHNEDGNDLLWFRLTRFAHYPALKLALLAFVRSSRSSTRDPSNRKPGTRPGFLLDGCLTMTYFRMGAPHYHRRATVSRSCSGWEGVVPAGYDRQALTFDHATARSHSEEVNWIGLAQTPHNRSALTVMGSSRTGN